MGESQGVAMALATAIGANRTLTELDVSGNRDGLWLRGGIGVGTSRAGTGTGTGSGSGSGTGSGTGTGSGAHTNGGTNRGGGDGTHAANSVAAAVPVPVPLAAGGKAVAQAIQANGVLRCLRLRPGSNALTAVR